MYIECNPLKGFGQPTLIGRRLTVYDIVTKIYYENSLDEALDDYEINFTEANAALSYCMHLECKNDANLVSYCDGCMLRTLQDGWNFDKMDYIEVNKHGTVFTIKKNSDDIFLGTLDELENSEFGKVTWLLAEEAFTRL